MGKILKIKERRKISKKAREASGKKYKYMLEMLDSDTRYGRILSIKEKQVGIKNG